MAKLPDGIFGGIRGRIGNIVGVKRNGEFHIRSVPSAPKNPKTEKQQRNRNMFGAASSLTARLAPFIKTSFSTVDDKTWRGACISYNMKSAIVPSEDGDGYEVDFSNLIVSAGVLKQVSNSVAERDEDGNIRITWTDNSGDGNAMESDRVLMLALNSDNYALFSVLKGVHRKDEVATIELPKSFQTRPMHIYLSLISADEAIASNSDYLGVVDGD